MGSLEELCNVENTPAVAIIGMEEDSDEITAKVIQIKARYKIALCRLRSPNETRTDPRFDIIISHHIRRESLRNIVQQLLTSGSALRPASRQAPYLLSRS
jgi:hypothetical protein